MKKRKMPPGYRFRLAPAGSGTDGEGGPEFSDAQDFVVVEWGNEPVHYTRRLLFGIDDACQFANDLSDHAFLLLRDTTARHEAREARA